MGTHGSLTKAGKVRSITPKIDPMPRPPTNPKRRNRINYRKRVLLNRPAGQWRPGR
jgi:small subunit ribosomal protein S30e